MDNEVMDERDQMGKIAVQCAESSQHLHEELQYRFESVHNYSLAISPLAHWPLAHWKSVYQQQNCRIILRLFCA